MLYQTSREVHTKCYLPIEEIKDYNIIIDWRNFFDNIRKIETGQGDEYTTGCCILLDYNYLKEHYKIIAIDLSKHEKLDADSKQNNKLVLLKILKNLHLNFS